MSTADSNVNALVILDGWGYSPETEGNAVALARTPFIDMLEKEYPLCRLGASGEAVGLPEGTIGNSEVGHMNIGAGRQVLQELVRINRAVESGAFFENPVILDLMNKVKKKGKSLHLIGLLSDGGVHSHINHLFALVKTARMQGIENLYIHPVFDGRDTPPKSGIHYLESLQSFLADQGIGKVATLCGRFWAMDRDTRWDRVEKAFKLYTLGKGRRETKPEDALKAVYEQGGTDEFVEPVVIGNDTAVSDGDGIMFFNFRADRARELTRAFTEEGFSEFNVKDRPSLSGFVSMTRYDEHFDIPAAFMPQHLDNIFGQVLSRNGLSQLRLAETEKFAHVTYFFNGGDENVFPKEEHILIPSPRDVATYDLKPEMSALEIAQTAVRQIESGRFDFLVINFANMDMVGHTGVLEAAVKACETVDTALEKVVRAIWETGGTAVITADHGNSEKMAESDGSPHTAHTLNPVNFIAAGENFRDIRLKNGILGDIAPTILGMLHIEQPEDMTGEALYE
ncbi:MAG: 2,3-bisphosphoglycerate-independent phosphoglycerate mutase [Desulfobacteraceae bacterium]